MDNSWCSEYHFKTNRCNFVCENLCHTNYLMWLFKNEVQRKILCMNLRTATSILHNILQFNIYSNVLRFWWILCHFTLAYKPKIKKLFMNHYFTHRLQAITATNQIKTFSFCLLRYAKFPLCYSSLFYKNDLNMFAIWNIN